MKVKAVQQKQTAQKANQKSTGIALAPPAYGLPFLDSSVVQRRENSSSPIQLMKFYHGTSLAAAQSLATPSVAVTATGKGELGGGFYMTHDLSQAAHIADYYTGKERRGPAWGVVEFDVDDGLLTKLNRKDVSPEEFEDYYREAEAKGNAVESDHSWTMAPIKDKKTPYVQHLFARDGIRLLNAKSTKRKLVLQGAVGIEKDKYQAAVDSYSIDSDQILTDLLNDNASEGSSDTDTSQADHEASASHASGGPDSWDSIREEAYQLIGQKNSSTPDIGKSKELVQRAQRIGAGALEELASIFDYADVGNTHRAKIGGLRNWREWLHHPRPAEQHPQ